MSEIVTCEQYSVGNLDALGQGPGFRKIRRPLGVTAFGMNAIVLPPGYDTGCHYHEHQEETYFVHSGRIAITFGDGTTHELGPGGLARVASTTPRSVKNVGEGEATYVIVGGKDGYVDRDGVHVNPDGSERR
jgi:mannose-6-phosphate isomerase-like protein (cupin superfamily)